MDVTITNRRAARAAHDSLAQFQAATQPVTKPPNGVFRTEAGAENRVWSRQYARNSGSGHLDNALRHIEHGTRGAWTKETLKTLRADRAAIGDGIAPKLVGDVRAHVADAMQELDAAIRPGHIPLGRLALIGAGIGAATIGTALVVNDG